jgi:hypothetical protein
MIACDRPECVTNNPVLAKFYFDSEEYKKELARELKNADPAKLTYWFDLYLEKGGAEYIDIHIQGADLCAEAYIQVNDWAKLKGIKDTGGLSYHGAQLKGLQLTIEEDSTHTLFIYKDIESTID